MSRVITYIDGFNLYFGMKSAFGSKYHWLNLEAMTISLLAPGDLLIATKYFTSRVSNDPPKEKRQRSFIDANLEITKVELFEGRYQVIKDGIKCKSCPAKWDSVREKMTDVQIATHMLTDAFLNTFDKAILVTGDTDLIPTIRMIKRHHPTKDIVIAFPPHRSRRGKELKLCADSHFSIQEHHLRDNQLPNPIYKRDGYTLFKPTEWV